MWKSPGSFPRKGILEKSSIIPPNTTIPMPINIRIFPKFPKSITLRIISKIVKNLNLYENVYSKDLYDKDKDNKVYTINIQ